MLAPAWSFVDSLAGEIYGLFEIAFWDAELVGESVGMLEPGGIKLNTGTLDQ